MVTARPLACPGLLVDERAHPAEHSLQVQLPFVQEVLGEVVLLQLLSGHMPASTVARVLEPVWGGPETLVVASSGLAHYQDQGTAAALDRVARRGHEPSDQHFRRPSNCDTFVRLRAAFSQVCTALSPIWLVIRRYEFDSLPGLGIVTS